MPALFTHLGAFQACHRDACTWSLLELTLYVCYVCLAGTPLGPEASFHDWAGRINSSALNTSKAAGVQPAVLPSPQQTGMLCNALQQLSGLWLLHINTAVCVQVVAMSVLVHGLSHLSHQLAHAL